MDVTTNESKSTRRRFDRLSELLGPYGICFRNRNLALLFSGQAISALGDWMYITIVVILAYQITGSATIAGLLTFTRLLPYVLFMPLSGVLADRFDRKRLMIGADLGRAVCMLGLLAVDSRQTIWLAFPLVFVSTCLFSLFRPALGATVPAVAGSQEDLVQANALMAQISGISLLLGPALAGMLIVLGQERSAFVINAVTYFASTLTLLSLRIPMRQEEPRSATTSWLSDTLTGFRFILRERHDGLEAVTLTTWGGSCFNGAIATLTVVLAAQSWHVGAQGVGFLNAAAGAGALLGGFLIGAFIHRLHLATGYIAAMAATGLSIALIGLSPVAFAGAAVLAAYGLFDVFNQVMGDTIIQTSTPDALLGRVYGAFEAIVVSGLLLGALVAGPLVGAFGPRVATLGFALVPLAMLAVHLPRLRTLDRASEPPIEIGSSPSTAELDAA